MKLPVSDKTSSFGIKPHIKKGYYPGILLSVQPYIDKATGKLKEGNWGHQLIFEFAVYKKDSETDAPIEPMQYLPNPENIEDKKDVVIAKFVYHEYIDKNTGQFRTAITPNSAITHLLKALGWEFSTESVDPEEFVGNWVELNIDDFEYKSEDKTLVASTIKDINLYKGPAVSKDIKKVEIDKPKDIKKQVKHESVDKNKPSLPPEKEKKIKELKDKLASMEQLNKDGHLTDGGLTQVREQLESEIEKVEKE